MAETDKVFSGAVPELYESHLVPLIFEPYAADLVARIKPRGVERLLEIAAGTGVVTRALAAALPPVTSIAATETVSARSRAESPRIPAVAYCQGTPLRNEIEARDPSGLAEATDVATEALSRRFGLGPVDGAIQAHVIMVEA